jgi:hypothetical protein
MGEGLSQNWTTLWEVLFGYPPDEAFVAGLQEYLDGEFPRTAFGAGWRADDMKAALLRISEDARKAGRRAKPPTAGEIKTAIIAIWYERKTARQAGEPAQEQCALCNRGSVTWAPELAPPYTVDSIMDAYQVTVPCRCENGRKLPPALHRPTDAQWAVILAQRKAWNAPRERGAVAHTFDGVVGNSGGGE